MNTSNQESVLELDNVKFNYPSSKKRSEWLIDIKSLKVKRGEKIFIYGPSGSGKSTLLNLLTGILRPNEGQVKVLGEDFSKLRSTKRDHFRGQHIGYIFQSFNLIPYLSVRDNILLPTNLHKKRKSNMSKLGGESFLNDIAKVLGIENDLDKKAYQMSLGGQQRVAAARALMGSPEIIIADEPTSSLDEDRTEEFLKELIALNEQYKTTLIFVSHDSRLKKHFDRSLSLAEIQTYSEQSTNGDRK